MLLEPEPPTAAHLVLLESTYGDREHKAHADTLSELVQILHTAAVTGEHVLVPVFAVGRAQEFLSMLAHFEQSGRLTLPPVYLDSPMAIEVLGLSQRHATWYQPAIRRRLEAGEPLVPTGLQLCESRAASMALNAQRGAIILAGSGMCEAGRIVHHLKHHLWRPGVQVIIVGFQAQGTTGRALVEGARRVRVLGEDLAVQAQIHTLGGFSAHAGQRELLAWVAPLLASGAQVALVHGEEDKRLALAACLQEQTQQPIYRPLPGDRVVLCKRGSPLVWQPAPQPQRAARPRRATPIVWHPALHRG